MIVRSEGCTAEARQLQVLQQTANLTLEVERLESAVGGLEERLCKVVRQEPSKTREGQPCAPEARLVPLAEILRNLVGRVNRVNGIIDDIKDRLEV